MKYIFDIHYTVPSSKWEDSIILVASVYPSNGHPICTTLAAGIRADLGERKVQTPRDSAAADLAGLFDYHFGIPCPNSCPISHYG